MFLRIDSNLFYWSLVSEKSSQFIRSIEMIWNVFNVHRILFISILVRIMWVIWIFMITAFIIWLVVVSALVIISKMTLWDWKWLAVDRIIITCLVLKRLIWRWGWRRNKHYSSMNWYTEKWCRRGKRIDWCIWFIVIGLKIRIRLNLFVSLILGFIFLLRKIWIVILAEKIIIILAHI